MSPKFKNRRSLVVCRLLVLGFSLIVSCEYTDPQNLDQDFLSAGPSANCKTERKEQSDCVRFLYNYFLALCDKDVECLIDNGYIVQPWLCGVLYEPLPGYCD